MNPEPNNLEAVFWKQRYFELLLHTNKVIAMLSRAPLSPQMPFPVQPPTPEQNGAQVPTEGRESVPEN